MRWVLSGWRRAAAGGGARRRRKSWCIMKISEQDAELFKLNGNTSHVRYNDQIIY